MTARSFQDGWRDEFLNRIKAASLSPEQMTALAEELACLAETAVAYQHVQSELTLSSRAIADARREIARLRALEPRSEDAKPEPLQPRPVPADAGGSAGLRPDPRGAQTPAGLIAVLSLFRVWAGNPSYREMARRSGRLSAATMCTVLRSDKLPARLEVIDAIVEGCGGTEEDRRRFATAWRALAMGTGNTPATGDPAGPWPAAKEHGTIPPPRLAAYSA